MRIGFVSDIHEDLVSLEKAIRVLQKRSVDIIACTGDMVGFSDLYYPYLTTRDANQCVDLLRECCQVIVPGNHDLFSVKRLTSYQSGIEYPEKWFELSPVERQLILGDKIWTYEDDLPAGLDQDNLAFLQSLPEIQIIETGEVNILLSHFLFPDITGSLKKKIDETSDFIDHLRFMKKNNCELAFIGHMHVEGMEIVGQHGHQAYRFRRKKLKKGMSCIALPAIARGRNKSGVAIFDTKTYLLESIRIRHDK